MVYTSRSVIPIIHPTPDGGIRVPIDLGLSLVSRKLSKWNDEDIVMEIGCGYGTIGLHCTFGSQKNFKKYFVIDIDPVVIEFQRNMFSQGKVEYHVGEIESLSTFKEEWLGKITKLISTNAFHCLRTSSTQRPAFQNVFNLLAPGGEAILLFAVWHPFWEVDYQILKLRKWEAHYDILSHMRWSWKIGMDEYVRIIIDMGFEVLSWEPSRHNKVYNQNSELRDDYVEYCRRFLPPVPDAIREDLMNDRLFHLWKYPDMYRNGQMILNFHAVGLHLRKPSYLTSRILDN